MAKQRQPIDQIKDCIQQSRNFLLSGGAGSGKTYSLVEVINHILSTKNSNRVACITYTNIAVDEIRERVPYENLYVSTIHEFLWDAIKAYQPNLKYALKSLVSEGEITYKGEEDLTEEYFEGHIIEYRDWSSLSSGVISHDDVIKLALKIFQDYPLIRKIVADKWDFILIDEYQDTFDSVIKIFLDYLKDQDIIIGFFGDSMQAIYENGGEILDQYVDHGRLKKIVKDDNWRCSIEVIDVINKLREDGLVQKQRTIDKKGRRGSTKFIYSVDKSIEDIKKIDFFRTWDFSNPLKTKELYLTHRLISEGAGFFPIFEIYSKDPILNTIKYSKYEGESLEECINQKKTALKKDRPEVWEMAMKYSLEQLKDIYVSTDQLVEGGAMKKDGRGDTKDRLQRHLDKIQACHDYYRDGDIKQFVDLTDYQVKSIKDKKVLREIMDSFSELVSKKQDIGEIIDWANENGIITIDDKLQQFIDSKSYVYERVRSIPYEVFQNLYKYNEKVSPYSTQHGVKGAEYENVLIVLDNGGWNNYNFENMFTGKGKDTVLARTKKLFYVGCSRAMNNLAVYYFDPNQQVIDKAEDWFGSDNIINADD